MVKVPPVTRCPVIYSFLLPRRTLHSPKDLGQPWPGLGSVFLEPSPVPQPISRDQILNPPEFCSSFLLRHAPCGQVKLLIVAQGCFDFCCPRPALRLWEVSCLCSPCWSIIFFDVLLKIHLFQKDRWSKRGRKLEGLLIKAHFPKKQQRPWRPRPCHHATDIFRERDFLGASGEFGVHGAK